MTKVVRAANSHRFLTPAGEWTDDVEKARHFSNILEANEAAKQLNLKNVEFYFSYDSRTPNTVEISIPLK
jgi:hypothetical protein